MGAGWTCRGPARPRRAASSSVPAVGEGRPQWPPSPGVATHPYPLQRDGVPAGTLIAQGQSGDSGPQRLLEFPLCFLERVLPESGSLGATTWTSQACPVTPPLCAQETPISDGCTKKSLQRAQPRGTEGLPGLSVDRALQGLMDRGCTHSPEGCWAKATPHVRWAWSSTPVLRGRRPSACLCHSWPPPDASGPFPLRGAAVCLVASPPNGPALPVSLTCHDPNSPNGFSLGPFSVSSCLSRVIPEWQLR